MSRPSLGKRLYPWGNRFVDGERCNNANMVGTTLPVDEFLRGFRISAGDHLSS